ncbi:MAG TPA: nucleotidyltransferase [archaeon]|nr:nucleotidyltransferase [archaeon]
MEIDFTGNKIKIKRELSILDKFAIGFAEMLEKNKIKYVVMGGYTSILFGKVRTTEDIDIFIEEMPFERFNEFMKKISKQGYEAMNSDDAKELYSEFLKKGIAIRIFKKSIFPNAEIKFPKDETDFVSLNSPTEVEINNKKILVAPFEIQIAYKLYLGSKKDIEDAKFLFELAKEKISKEKLRKYANMLGADIKILGV